MLCLHEPRFSLGVYDIRKSAITAQAPNELAMFALTHYPIYSWEFVKKVIDSHALKMSFVYRIFTNKDTTAVTSSSMNEIWTNLAVTVKSTMTPTVDANVKDTWTILTKQSAHCRLTHCALRCGLSTVPRYQGLLGHHGLLQRCS
jgi:hypothetical protein